MAEYVNIQGQNILIVSSDPSNPTQGQIWYNTTSGTLKGLAFDTTGSWSTSGNLNQGRYLMSGGAGAGTQTAALTFGGSNPGGSALSATESFNGTSWTTIPASMNTSRLWNMGLGGQTTGLCIGGYTGSVDTNATEKWNGSVWTSSGNLNNARRVTTGFGSQTACIAANGAAPRNNYAESFNGTSWTTLATTNVTAEGRASTAGSPQTAGIIFGGGASLPADTSITTVESWNGSTWTNLPTSMNVGRRYFGGVGSGPTDAFAYGGGGTPGSVALNSSESYNGSAWTTAGSLSVARRTQGNAAAATTSAAATWGGDDAGSAISPSSTELFSKGLVTRTITAS
jgi:hypothetical protein